MIQALHNLIFPNDELIAPTAMSMMWVGEDESGTPVAFCTARKLRWENAVFLERAGVLPLASGLGLQRRMIRLRERWAREIDATTCLTYTMLKNYASIVNLLRCGYRFYSPHSKWVGDRVHYFRRDFE